MSSRKGKSKQRITTPVATAAERWQRRSSDRRALLPLIVVAAGIFAYAGGFSGAMVLDDDKHIINNPRIRDVVPLSNTMSGRRPIVDLSLALNYAYGELQPSGYHAFNLAIHLLAGLTLFGIVRRTLLADRLRRRFADSAPWLALAISLIWVVHPLQTQSVQYVIQRGESLMGLFYLLTFYCVIRAAHASRGTVWYVLAIASCAMGMGTKAVIITAPLAVLLYDRVFLAKSVGELLRARWTLYLGLIATLAVLFVTDVVAGIFNPGGRSATVGFHYRGASPLVYLLTQAGVVVHYFKLAIWPHPLCLDYGWSFAASAADVLAPASVMLLALAATVWALVRRPAAGLTAALFFLILAPTSSIIPIKDPAFEHRMYLPLAAIVSLAVLGAHALLSRLAAARRRHRNPRVLASAIVLIVAATCMAGTYRRTQDYANASIMWSDVIRKRPTHARAFVGLGTMLFNEAKAAQKSGSPQLARKKFAEAERSFINATRFRPKYADAHYNLGNTLAERGKLHEAISAYLITLKLKFRYAKCHYNLANTYKKLGRLDQAIAGYRRTVEIKPTHISAHINLGNTLKLQGLFGEAIDSYHRALALDPDYANAHLTLGLVLQASGRLREAAAEYRLTLQSNPTPRQQQMAQAALQDTLEQLGE